MHVVDQPLSPYVRYELAVYVENVTAGEDVRIADRSVTDIAGQIIKTGHVTNSHRAALGRAQPA